jgi:hypothetical protein
MIIKSVSVTEYENNEPDTPAEIATLPELSSFEWYLKSLPNELQDEVIKIDEYLLKDMKSSLKFKKSIDKYGNVTYVSPCGFQYKMRKYGEQHEANEHDAGQLETSWIKNWAKEAEHTPDYTALMLNKLAETSPEFADKMFSKLKGCTKTTCNRNAVVEYNGESKQTCSSTIMFTWFPLEFKDIRKVIAAASEVMTANKR